MNSMKHTGEVSLINEASSLVDDLRGEISHENQGNSSSYPKAEDDHGCLELEMSPPSRGAT